MFTQQSTSGSVKRQAPFVALGLLGAARANDKPDRAAMLPLAAGFRGSVK